MTQGQINLSGLITLQDKQAAETEILAGEVRARRDALLADTAWILERQAEEEHLGLSRSLSTEKYDQVLKYRQALRNVPQQPGFPTEIDWPTPPQL